jgi:tetratricopeptide (TPR) repeat protein
MKPLGTITCYFPFIDDDTRKILESTMNKAYDYYDFVNKMKELVLENDSSDLVIYFAIHHAAQLFDFKAINAIRNKYGNRSILLPNLFFASAVQGNIEDLEKVKESADFILATDPDEWLVLEMRFMKFEAEMRRYPKTLYDSTNLDAIVEMIENNPDFGFYETTLYHYFAVRAYIDGDSDERNRCFEKAIQSARKHGDDIRLVHLLVGKADIVESEDRIQARNILNDSRDIAESLGNKIGYANVLEKIGKIEVTRGEYNHAIDRYLAVVSIRESLGLDNGNNSLLLSTLYNIIGEPESGAEWGRMAEDQFKNRPFLMPRAVLNQAWSLVLMKKITEALVLIDTVREEIMKSGRETHLAWLHFVTGLVEIADNNLTAAASSIEEALKIYEKRSGVLMMQVIFMHHLAQIEVFQLPADTEFYPILALLEEKATEEDLPGIQGQVLLLKAEIALLRNDDSGLREIIQQIRPLAEAPSMEFLQPFLEKLMNKA